MAADSIQALGIWRKALVESVRRDTPDLTARQLAVLLTEFGDLVVNASSGTRFDQAEAAD